MIIQKSDNYPSSLNSIQFDELNFEDINNNHNKTIKFNLFKKILDIIIFLLVMQITLII